MPKQKIVVCTKGKTCRQRGGKEVFCALEKQIEKQGLEKEIRLKKSECLGMCGRGPTVKVKPHKLYYGGVCAADSRDIISSLLGKSVVDRLRLKK